MKRLALVALIACLVPVSATAGTMSVQWFPGGNAHIVTLYNDQNQPIDSFTTFCLENIERINPGTPYPYTVDPVVIEATGSLLPHFGNPPFTVLTQGAVELYLAYVNALFPGLTAADYQNAVWAAQGYGVSYNNLLSAYVGKQDAYDGSLGFAVVYNPYDDDGPHQSFLRVPDGGATLMLLGGALMGLGALRRKFRG